MLGKFFLKLKFCFLCKKNPLHKCLIFRHKEDNRANRRKVSVIRKDEMRMMTSENIQVGDILYLTEDQEVPCDVIVLSSSHKQVCFHLNHQKLSSELSGSMLCDDCKS